MERVKYVSDRQVKLCDTCSTWMMWRWADKRQCNSCQCLLSMSRYYYELCTLCGLWVERIHPLHFLTDCCKRRLNQALSVFHLAQFLSMLLFIRATSYVALVYICMCYVSLVVLVKLSILAKWLARKTPLRMPVHGKENEIIFTKPWLKSIYDFRFVLLFYCIFDLTLVLHNIFNTPISCHPCWIKRNWSKVFVAGCPSCRQPVGITHWTSSFL